MRITNLNPVYGDIGASAWLLNLQDNRLLLDAGTHPKRHALDSLPLYDRIKKEDLDAIAITHCHHDHVGSLPLAMRHFPRAHVLMTDLSYYVVERILHNSVNVMTRQRAELGIPDYPLYDHDEVDELSARFQGFRYNREIEWAAFHKARAGLVSPTLEFFDAGHTLGSAGVLVRGSRETMFYTGDICFHDQTLLRGARCQEVQADVLLMETTRGTRELPPGFSRETEVARLAESIQRVTKRKGSVLIPAFALGRTQEILALLALMMREGKLKRQPIYIGGLGRVFTEIYDLEAHRTCRQHSGLMLNEALDLQVLESHQAEKMRFTGGRIFVVTSGMMSEHTAAYDLAARMIGDEKQAVFFVGYTDPDTPGGHLRVTKPGDTFLFSPTVGELTRRCEMDIFDMTAHANREDMLDFVAQVNPRSIVLGHGQEQSIEWYKKELHARHPKVKIFAPGPGETVDV
jgi:Cft2 family RNA processing exonuclease